MDAFELPLPVNVLVDKLMASDGLERGGVVEGSSSFLQKGSRCVPSCAEYVCSSRNKKVDNGSYMHETESMSPCSKYGAHSKEHHMEEADADIQLSPNHKGKLIQRKSAKRPVNSSSKRLRNGENESCKENAGNLGHEAISNEVEHDPSRSTIDDKSPTAKQRRVHDSKRIDKKNCRSTMKNKYECFISKTGIHCSDTFANGNKIADHLDDLSLGELLHGSYKYLKLPQEKGKKPSVVNDNILLSVRKACSLLSPPTLGVSEKTNSLKASQNFSGSDCEIKEDDVDESLTKLKAQNSFHENILGSTLLPPKKIVSQLSLPAVHELEGFVLNPSVCPAPVQITEPATTHARTCISSSAKSTSQGKWIRIGSSCSTSEDDKSFLSGLVFKYECDEDSISQQKINGVLQDIKSFTSNFQPLDGSSVKPMGTYPDVEMPDLVESVNRSCISSSCKSRMLQHHGGHCFDTQFINHASRESTASEVDSRCKGNEINQDLLKFNLSLKDKPDPNESPSGSICGCSMSDSSYQTTGIESGCSSWQRSIWEKYKQDFSSEELSAATILCGMSHCSDSIKTASTSNGRIRWPKGPSMKTMKARKPSHLMDNQASMQSATEGKADLVYQHLGGREAPRWSLSPLGAASSPSRLEKDLSQTNPSRSPLSTQLFSRADKACDNLIRKMLAKPSSSATFGGSFIKDWIRSRNKKL